MVKLFLRLGEFHHRTDRLGLLAEVVGLSTKRFRDFIFKA